MMNTNYEMNEEMMALVNNESSAGAVRRITLRTRSFREAISLPSYEMDPKYQGVGILYSYVACNGAHVHYMFAPTDEPITQFMSRFWLAVEEQTVGVVDGGVNESLYCKSVHRRIENGDEESWSSTSYTHDCYLHKKISGKRMLYVHYFPDEVESMREATANANERIRKQAAIEGILDKWLMRKEIEHIKLNWGSFYNDPYKYKGTSVPKLILDELSQLAM